MENNYENIFLRLAYSLKEAKSLKNTTIILGAGCSLSSTKSDISTQGIMKQCLIEHDLPTDEVDSYTWEILYKKFVNIVWDGKAEKERENLLKGKFVGLKPTEGHQCLKMLIEHGYIHNVITTNFDMLLENTFADLSYYKRVGDSDYTIVGDKPFFNLLKIHGDLEEGLFKFAPNELSSLPNKLCEDIGKKSNGPLILVGYRGQDIGLMNALCRKNQYGVYWVSTSFDITDMYENKKIVEFMTSRGSTNNFLHGKEFGDFGKIMNKLSNHFIHPSHNSIIRTKEFKLNIEWKNTTIVEMLRIYSRIYELFLDILDVSNKVQNELTWDSENYAYSNNYDEHLHSFLYFFNSQKLPSNLLHIPNNELDALILGVSIDVSVRTIGNNVLPKDYINKVHLKFNEEYNQNFIDDTFWIAVEKIANSEYVAENVVNINMHNKLALKTFDVPFKEFNELLRSVSFLALLVPIDFVDDTRIDMKYKVRQLLNGRYEDIQISTNLINIDLGRIGKEESEVLYDNYINILPDIHILNSSNYLDSNEMEDIVYKSKWINIAVKIENTSYAEKNIASNLNEVLLNQVQMSERQFLQLGYYYTKSQNKHIDLQFDKDIKKFVESDKIGMFAVGPSGCGKTSALQNYIINKENTIKSIIISPKNTKTDKTGLSLFLNIDIEEKDEFIVLENINNQLEMRNNRLLLIFEGLNEINITFENQQDHYKKLLDLADKIYINNFTKIKLIVTCREQAYYQYRNNSLRQLSLEYFYNQNSKGVIEEASYKIHPLSKEEEEQLCNEYISKELQEQINSVSMKGFWRNPGITNNSITPFFIAIAGDYLKSIEGTEIIRKGGTIYDLFSNAMLKGLEESDCFLAKKIIYIYFDIILELRNSNSEVTKFKILNKLDFKFHSYFDNIVNKLIDANILIKDYSKSEKIKFRHDKIEEFFFKTYIEEYDYKGIEFLDSIFSLCNKNIIYQGGTLEYLLELEKQNRLSELKEIVTSLYINHTDFIPKFIIEILANSQHIHNCLNYLLNSDDLRGSKQLLSAIIWGLDINLQDYSSVTYNFKTLLYEIKNISHKSVMDDEAIAYILFYESKIEYYSNNYYDAINLAKESKQLISENNQTLRIKIDIHYSVILMEQGYSKQCIEILERDYTLCCNMSDFKLKLEVGIELGRALNHSGQIDRTLQLYDDLLSHKEKINDIYILARIYEQKANVLNNLMYTKLQNGFIDKKKLCDNEFALIKQLFDDANYLYDKSCKLLVSLNAIFTYSGVIPEKINTLISYSFSIEQTGIDECEKMIHDFDKLFNGIKTPFESDYSLSKAYYHEYLKNYDLAEMYINIALKKAIEMKIKNKEAKCRGFYSQFIYRQLCNGNDILNLCEKGIKQLEIAIDYYEKNTLIENNVTLENSYKLKSKFIEIKTQQLGL